MSMVVIVSVWSLMFIQTPSGHGMAFKTEAIVLSASWLRQEPLKNIINLVLLNGMDTIRSSQLKPVIYGPLPRLNIVG